MKIYPGVDRDIEFFRTHTDPIGDARRRVVAASGRENGISEWLGMENDVCPDCGGNLAEPAHEAREGQNVEQVTYCPICGATYIA